LTAALSLSLRDTLNILALVSWASGYKASMKRYVYVECERRILAFPAKQPSEPGYA
jgi:hypothetical protein